MEYMQLAETLDAEPIYVFNSGDAAVDYMATSSIGPLVQNALDSLQFIMGPAGVVPLCFVTDFESPLCIMSNILILYIRYGHIQ